MRLSDIIPLNETKSASPRKFVVHWGERGSKDIMGSYEVEARDENGAKRQVKQMLDARFMGGSYRIAKVTDVELEAKHARAIKDFDTRRKLEDENNSRR